MKVKCPGCSAEFAVDDNRILPQGLQVRCPRCFKAMQVGGQDAPFASDLEQQLGADLSGPSEEPPPPPRPAAAPPKPAAAPPKPAAAPPKPAAAPPKPAAPLKPAAAPPPVAAAAPQAGARPGKGGPAWPDMEGLNTRDLSMIGTYQKVVAPETPVSDAVWNGAPPKARPSSGPVRRSNEPPPAESPFAAPAVPPPPEEEFAPVEDASAPSPWGEAGSAPASPLPDEPLESTSEEAAPAAKPAPDAAPPPGAEEPADEFQFSEDVLTSPEMARPAAFGPGAGEDAPDSIFAMEEASGVFSRQKIEESGAGGTQPGKTVGLEEEGGAFGGGAGEPQLELGDFKRETITREKVGETAAAEPPKRKAATPPLGGGPTLDDIDFASLMDDGSGAKPAEAGGAEMFFVDSPSLAEEGFEKPKAPAADAFAAQEIGLDGLDGLGGGAAAGAPAPSGDVFDVDMPVGDGGPAIPTLDTLKVGAVSEVGRDMARPVGADRPLPRRRKSGLGAFLVAVVVLAGGGVGAWQLGLLNEMLGTGMEEQVQKVEKEKPKVGFDSRLLAAPADYSHRLEILFKDLELKPDLKVEIEEELLWELAWYGFLYPEAFTQAAISKEEKLSDRYQAYRKTYGGEVFARKLEAMELGAQSQWAKGEQKFSEYRALKVDREAELLENRKLTPQLAREDKLLSAWFMIQNGRWNDGREALKDLATEKATELHPLFLLAMADAAEARKLDAAPGQAEQAAALRSMAVDRLKGLVEQFPQNSESKLLLAELLARDAKFDQAVSLASECLEKARETKNVPLQLRVYRDLALFLKDKGDKETLLKTLEEMKASVLEKNPGVPEPEDLLLMLCSLYVEKDQMEKALGTLELCKTCATADYFFLLATAYQKRKLYETAVMKAKAGLEKFPKDIRLLLLLSELSRQTGQTNSAVAYLEQVLKVRPDNSAAALALAHLFLDLQDPGNARRILLEAERFTTDSLEIEQLLAQVTEATGDVAGTVAALTRILEIKDDDAVRKKLAGYLIQEGSYEEALKHFEVLKRKNLITPELRQAYAKSLKATGKIQEAVDVLKDLLKENPGDIVTARFLADIYLQKEDFFNARIYLEAARRADSKNAEVQFLIGTCCLKLQDDGCALESFQQAVALAPDKLDYRVDYANLLFRISRKSQGPQRSAQLAEARKSFDYIISRYASDLTIPKDRQSADIFFNRGTILFETGHFDEALKDLSEAMSRAQSRYDILAAYADALYKINRYDQALKYYQEMVDSRFEPAHAYFYMGTINLFRGKKEQAKEHFLDCISKDSKAYPDAHRYLGDIFREKGLRKKAADHYRTYLDLVGDKGPAAEDVKAALKKL